ncbi:MAG: efflux RND transporter periplasmic adaptor subunit [Methylococcales bacterium]|jgi:RND family efflux transporter MFP subunit|nr:efflux RND transporter periplasmic adaptor subunit [Methylococcales bacterium]
MKTLFKLILPVIVITISLFTAQTILDNQPEAKKYRVKPTAKIVVKTIQVKRQNYQIILSSQGIIQPRIISTINSQVSGRITQVSSVFQQGGSFKKNSQLMKIDDRDYQFTVNIVQSELAKARLALAEEQARVNQASKNWGNLGDRKKPSDLVLRKPHLLASKAAVIASEARLKQAKLNFNRTTITAPYEGRVLQQLADLGQYVNVNTALAKVFSADSVEIRLPLTSRQLHFINLTKQPHNLNSIKVTFSLQDKKAHTWHGHLIRLENELDSKTQQLFIVAQINQNSTNYPLKIGQFLQASIQGKILKNVIVLPRSALIEGHYVMILDAANRLQKRIPKILWSSQHEIIIGDGIEANAMVNLTPIHHVISGTKVYPEKQSGKKIP